MIAYPEHVDVRTALKRGIAELRDANVPSYTLAAELLLMHALGRDRAWLYAHPEEVIPGNDAHRFLSFILPARRRRAHAVHHRQTRILGHGI